MKACNQCGKCCLKYGGQDLAASSEEIELWEIFNPDIFKYVKKNQIWFDPQSGQKLQRCPFLELAPKTDTQTKDLYQCRIYLNRPEDCRQYPSLVSEMIRDECEMIESVDLTDLTKAERSLRKLKD